MTEKMCLLRADECERRSRAASDRQLKAQWSQLSIEWHYLASSLRGLEQDDIVQDDIVVTEPRVPPQV
jgi:hypothetical protein